MGPEPREWPRSYHTARPQDTDARTCVANPGGASGRYNYLREIALDYAPVLRERGFC